MRLSEQRVHADVEHMLSRMSLRERVGLLTGAGFWVTAERPEIGLRAMVLSDGPVGVRGQTWDERPSAALPCPTSWAASWDEALVTRLGGLLAAEARRKGVDVVLGPTVNLQRSPLAGRHYECLSEDPLLSGRVAVAYVRGLQACGVGATAKHYVANDAETNRFTVDVRVDDRTLREVYLAPFERLVVDGGVWVVMAAYNGVNGATMTDSSLLTQPLMTEWGFDGVVVSDWYAARSTRASVLAGLGLVMPGPTGPWGDALLAAVEEGAVPAAVIEDRARRMIRLAARVGALADVSPPGAPPELAPDGMTRLLREAAAAGTVLLRNVGGLLPLDRRALRRVAVCGANATVPAILGGGSSGVTPQYAVTPLDALRAGLGDEVEVIYAVGAHNRPGLSPVSAEATTCPHCGQPGLAVRYREPGGRLLRAEHRTVGRLIWVGQEILRGADVEVATRFRAPSAGRWRLGFVGVGAFTFTLNGERVADAVLRPDRENFAGSFLDPPQQWVERDLRAGEEVDVVLVHRLDPELEFAQVVLGVRAPRGSDVDELGAAVDAARTADVAVVVVGTTEQVETEGRDRRTLALPGRQDALVSAVAAANPRTVVVVNSGAPIAVPWRDDVAAILLCWFPGQEGGGALADVLLGDIEPGGRLPCTWPARDADVPVLSTRPRDGQLAYAEGLHVGYRAWLRAGASPAYPFGHGLGYTTWTYQGLDAPATVPAGRDVTVRVRVGNRGPRPGKEVVQAYLSRAGSAVDRPVQWLAGFAVVRAEPGQAAVAELRLAARTFQHWSTADGGWRTEPGAFRLSVGRSVADLSLARTVTVTD
jgi:beta-glucosidase